MKTLVPSFLTGSFFDWIFFLLSGIKKCLKEFKLRPGPITDYRILCSCETEKSTFKLVAGLVPSCFIGSSSFLQMRKIIKS